MQTMCICSKKATKGTIAIIIGVSFLCTAGTFLARIILNRLIGYTNDIVIPALRQLVRSVPGTNGVEQRDVRVCTNTF